MNIDLSRRGFFKLAGAGVAATSLGAMGFGEAEAAEQAHVRAFKLATTTETRNTCPYCSVACGIILYSKGDVKAGETAELLHIEGDADHPTNRQPAGGDELAAEADGRARGGVLGDDGPADEGELVAAD